MRRRPHQSVDPARVGAVHPNVGNKSRLQPLAGDGRSGLRRYAAQRAFRRGGVRPPRAVLAWSSIRFSILSSPHSLGPQPGSGCAPSRRGMPAPSATPTLSFRRAPYAETYSDHRGAGSDPLLLGDLVVRPPAVDRPAMRALRRSARGWTRCSSADGTRSDGRPTGCGSGCRSLHRKARPRSPANCAAEIADAATHRRLQLWHVSDDAQPRRGARARGSARPTS